MKNSLSYKQFDLNGEVKYIGPELKALCREYRKKPTDAESILWNCLRNRKLAGFKFLRQHPIGGFIADFFCSQCRLIVEVDGGIHQKSEVFEKDRLKERFFTQNGYRMIRLKNEEVEEDLETILENLINVCKKLR